MRYSEDALYQRALKFLLHRTNYENFKSIPYEQMKRSRKRLREFLDYLGAPEKNFVFIHVAGTKGKGTTCCALERVYRAAGYRVGLFTSPHLVDVAERFQIDGKNCDKTLFAETLLRLVEKWKKFAAKKKREALEQFDSDEDPYVEKMTFFEWTLVLAVSLFARANVDVAIVEVGLGGRFDATNVCDADVSVLTSVSYDHCEQLGNTLLKIAGEKLGIVKTNAPLVCGVGFSRFLRLKNDSEPEPEDNNANAPEPQNCAQNPDSPDDSSQEKADCEKVARRPFTKAEKMEAIARKKAGEDFKRQKKALENFDPQTRISEKDLQEVCELAKNTAAERGAPFYQVKALSPFVAKLPTPPFDSVRRWNFEIALNVVGVLAERTQIPEGRALKDENNTGELLRLPVPKEAIENAAANFELPCRFETVSLAPTIVVDGAHNRASVAAFMKAAKERFPDKKIKILFAATLGKDVRGMIAEMATTADEVILTQRIKDERSEPVGDLIQTFEQVMDETCDENSLIRRKFRVAPDFASFLTEYAARGPRPDSVLCAIGSFYFAAQVRETFKKR